MTQHLIPIRTAFITFIVLSQLITIPLLIVRYRKDGAMTFWRVLMEYSFMFYLLSAFFLTLLPLPSKEMVESLTAPTTQLIPFQFIADILRESGLVWSHPSSYFTALKSGVVLQVVFNIVMLIPFGIYLRYYFNKSFKSIFSYSLLLSLFFEVTQLTGIYGIYSRAYRLFDVDDLILNTLGGAVGYCLTPFVMYLFPSREEIDKKVVQKSKEVPFLRRAIAYGIDTTLVKVIVDLILIGRFKNFCSSTLASFVILGSIYFFFKGESIGMKFLRLKILNSQDQNPTLIQSLLRSGSFSLFFSLFPFYIHTGFNTANNADTIVVTALLSWILLIFMYNTLIILHVLITGIIWNRPLIHERLSSTHLVSTLKDQ